MVMALEPEIILLDEPTAGMSIEETNRTAALIREVNRTTTIVVVEHDMQFIRQIADIVTVFHQGPYPGRGHHGAHPGQPGGARGLPGDVGPCLRWRASAPATAASRS